MGARRGHLGYPTGLRPPDTCMHGCDYRGPLCTVHMCTSAVHCRYDLAVDYITDPDFKAGLRSLVTEGVGIAAIVLGTRRGDPNAATRCE